MNPLKSLALAFTMYSRVPTPPVDWDGPHTRFTLAFFPVVGLFIGLCEFLWICLSAALNMNVFFAGAIAFVLPLLLTGGIHLDGFCDTCDALASHQSRQRKLEILKDSNVGAFAVIGLCLYFVVGLAGYVSLFEDLYNGVYSSSPLPSVLSFCLLFPLSRGLSGLLATVLPNARGSGLLFHFTDSGDLLIVRFVLGLQVTLYVVFMLYFAHFVGLLLLSGCLIAVMWYLSMSHKQFGGVTGDLAGWFLQMCELLAVTVLALLGNFA